jgi:hypothetical protein
MMRQKIPQLRRARRRGKRDERDVRYIGLFPDVEANGDKCFRDASGGPVLLRGAVIFCRQVLPLVPAR